RVIWVVESCHAPISPPRPRIGDRCGWSGSWIDPLRDPREDVLDLRGDGRTPLGGARLDRASRAPNSSEFISQGPHHAMQDLSPRVLIMQGCPYRSPLGSHRPPAWAETP